MERGARTTFQIYGGGGKSAPRGTFETGSAADRVEANEQEAQKNGGADTAVELDLGAKRPPPRQLGAGENKVWEVFCDIDKNRNGSLSKVEVAKMSKKLGITLGDSDLANAFDKMDRERLGVIDFDHFLQWWKQVQAERRREARMKARELFEQIDVDDSRTLEKAEVMQLSKQMTKTFKGEFDLDPPVRRTRNCSSSSCSFHRKIAGALHEHVL